jgi:hypothetical protein
MYSTQIPEVVLVDAELRGSGMHIIVPLGQEEFLLSCDRVVSSAGHGGKIVAGGEGLGTARADVRKRKERVMAFIVP